MQATADEIFVASYIIKALNASDTVIFIFSQGWVKKSLDP